MRFLAEGHVELTRDRRDYEAHYEPPKAAIGADAVLGEYRHRTWDTVLIMTASSVIAATSLGILAFVALSPRPPRPEVRARLIVLLVPFALAPMSGALGCAVTFLSRRGPAVKASRDGLEVSWAGVRPYRMPWGRPRRRPRLRITWPSLVDVSVTGSRIAGRSLTFRWRDEIAGQVCRVWMPDREIDAPIDRVAAELMALAGDEQARASLPIWEGDTP